MRKFPPVQMRPSLDSDIGLDNGVQAGTFRFPTIGIRHIRDPSTGP